MFLETSALTGENVEETFLKCARSILTKIESGTTSVSEYFLQLSKMQLCVTDISAVSVCI